MCTPKKELRDKLDHYLRFDAAPISEQEQDKKTSGNEPSQEEVLLNPLLWWKVSMSFLLYVVTDSKYCC